MGTVQETIAELWKPPKLRSNIKERHATWLELFYDLVFVVAVAELGVKLSKDISINGVFLFILLFVPVWWAWVHHTFYSDRFDTDSFAHRFLTITQMFAVGALAASVHDAFGETSVSFALSFAAIRLITGVFYFRCRHIEKAKPLAIRFSRMFFFSAFLWVSSIFVPVPWRFGIWIFTLAFEFWMVFLRSTRMIYATMPLSESHLPERFGLFTIIVLGESVAGMVAGLGEQELSITATLTAGFGLLLAFGYWWIYFENLDGSVLKGIGGWTLVSWVYIHLPLTISLTALGISVEHAIATEAGHSLEPAIIWLMSGALGISFFSIGITHRAVAIFKPETSHRQKRNWRMAAAGLVLVIGFVFANSQYASALLVVGVLTLVSLTQVVGDLFVIGGGDVTDQSVEAKKKELES